MSTYFQRYLETYSRIRMSEMLHFYSLEQRKSMARPSLIVNPLTQLAYTDFDQPVPLAAVD